MYRQAWFEQSYFEDSYCSNYLKYSGRYYDKLAEAIASECVMNARASKVISKHGTKRYGETFDGQYLPKDLAHLTAYKAEGIEQTLLQATLQTNDAIGRSR